MKQRSARVFSIICALLIAAPAAPHSDLEKPMFVAENGVDAGRCHDPAAPCRTLAYALDRVGKGGQVRVAGGRYEVADVVDMFHLVSGVVDVQGGYDDDGLFQEPSGANTTLVGVPFEYRAQLADRGFNVIADRKSETIGVLESTEKLLVQKSYLQMGLKADACAGGMVGGMACDQVDLVSHLPLASVSARPNAAADIWGFVDLNSNREYVIVGYSTGTGVFDVSNPETPREVGFIDGQQTVWRDIKVYQSFDSVANRWRAYAYVTTDLSTDGLFVIDLNNLPHRIQRVSYASDIQAAHNVYAANTDFGTGLPLTASESTLIIAGSNVGQGRFRSYSLGNPEAPGFIAMPASGEYMHDAASMIITDARKDTQCVNGTTYCEIVFDFNESTVDIWDVTVASSPALLSRTRYPNTGYTHSGWPTEDKQFLFVHDELDEQDFQLGTTLRTLSLSNLASPQLVNTWTAVAPIRAIDHNGFVRGNRYYMSNYTRGLTILDISDPALPSAIAHFDTSMFRDDSASFAGAWGVYPFLHSGNIAVADIEEGLYLLEDKSLDVPQGSISLTQASYGVEEGQSVTIGWQRNGGTSGAVGASFEIVHATSEDSDIDGMVGNGTWQNGDGLDKGLGISAANDGVSEGLEHFIVRLVAPTGGATLAGQTVANVYVSDPGATPDVQFDVDSITTAERGFATAVAVVKRGSSALGAVSVEYSVTGGDATAGSDFQGAASGTISWADGDADPKWIEFTIVDDGVGENDEFFELALANPSGATLGANSVLQVTIADGSGSIQPPNAVAGASQTVRPGATVTLDGNQSNDPDGDALTYAWTQTMGPAVSLDDPETASTTFVAPDVSSSTLLRFQLTVTDPLGLNDSATVSVTVSDTTQGGGLGSDSSGGGSLGWLLLLVLSALLVERVLLDNRLLAIRTRRDYIDRHSR